jgi:TetR/AcrR family transcriptional regulator
VTHREPTAPQRLLTAALPEFAVNGKAGARTDRIARLARVNKQLIHYYFGNKDGLYRSALAAAAAQIGAALSQPVDASLGIVEQLRRLVRGQFDVLARHPQLTQLLVHAEAEGEWLDAATKPLVERLTEGQATGFFRDDIDPAQVARAALVLHLGYFALRGISAGWGPAARWRDDTTELMVQACCW